MNEKNFFTKIDFNKTWDEDDWEKFFQAHDSYRNSIHGYRPGQKPLARIKFEGSDEVVAFEPVMRAYSTMDIPSIVGQLKSEAFYGDKNPELDYHPTTDEDPHYWGEGAPLGTVLIYRDCCRFAICTAQEIEKYLKRKDLLYRKKFGAEFEALRFHANWVAINVGEGHKIGYSEERIRGNIAKCRRALHHAELCLGLISRISLRTKSQRLRKELFSFAFQLRNALFDWTDELRLRVR